MVPPDVDNPACQWKPCSPRNAFNGTIFGRSSPERFPVTPREQWTASYSNYILKRHKFFLGDVDMQEYLMAVLLRDSAFENQALVGRAKIEPALVVFRQKVGGCLGITTGRQEQRLAFID